MRNHRPIIINAFARGGSNILMNLLLSHPDVCVSAGETHKVFKGTNWDPFWRKVKKRFCYDLPIRFLMGQDVLGAENYDERKVVPPVVQKHIDKILFAGRFVAQQDTHNRYRLEGVEYTHDELSNCRLLTKGLNGIVFTVDMFREMYPDAVFFALVRNGLAVCEGYVRRGFSAEFIANTYVRVVGKMLEANAKMPNYHLVRYEEMVNRPYEFMTDIYSLADLDVDQVAKVRLQSKKIMNASGERGRLKGGNREVFWYAPSQLGSHIKSDINENQIKQLTEYDKNKFLAIAGPTMEKIGYL
ncbi:MAG: sulfotransferase [Thermodesulfobacteriota bacterium]